MGKLDYSFGVFYNPLHFLEDNKITVPLQKCVRRYEWSTSEKKYCMNYLIVFLKFFECNLNSEVNAWGIISTSVIDIVFDNDYICITHYVSKP